MTATITKRVRWASLVAGVLAAAYVVAAALPISSPSLRASADAVAHGRVWLVLTSALEPQGRWPPAQVALVAVVAVVVARRESIGRWWACVLVGHVGSAIIAYATIAVVAALGIASARAAAAQPDYGVSCVLAGSTGALLVSGWAGVRRSGRPRRAADVAALAAGAAGALVFGAASGGWYASEHAIALLLGAGTAAVLEARVR